MAGPKFVRGRRSRICQLDKPALPLLPKEDTIGCPGALTTYTLAFYGRTGLLGGPATFQPTACNVIAGQHLRARIYRVNSPLWPALGRAIGLPGATEATFQGSKPHRV